MSLFLAWLCLQRQNERRERNRRHVRITTVTTTGERDTSTERLGEERE